jgi:hypothetical protein
MVGASPVQDVRILVIGVPGHPRVTRFQEALARANRPPAAELSWLAVARSPGAFDALDADRPTLVRIDSFGEDADTERAFLHLGYEAALDAGVETLSPEKLDGSAPAHGRIVAPRQQHLGFLAALERVELAVRERAAWHPLSHPADIRLLFDKSATSARYTALGVPVPRPLRGVTTLEGLRAAMRDTDLRSVYVKLTCGSSGAGIAIFTLGARDTVLTTVEVADDGLYNTRRLRQYSRASDVETVVGYLLREGSHVEENVPKARLDGLPFDCRILLIAEEPAFVVARRGPSPLTNLHLGAQPADLDRLGHVLPAELYEAALESCARIQSAHECFHLGIDVLFEDGFVGHRVLEANAFGDYLPKLRRDGRSVYDWEVERLSSTALAAIGR